MTNLCQWRVYELKNDIDLGAIDDFDGLFEEAFTMIDCSNEAISDFTWSTQRLRDTYNAVSTPVCDEHLDDFKRSDQVSLYLLESDTFDGIDSL